MPEDKVSQIKETLFNLFEEMKGQLLPFVPEEYQLNLNKKVIDDKFLQFCLKMP